MQRFLREECPNHPATAFGEAVAAAPSELRREDLDEERSLKRRCLQYQAEAAQAEAAAAQERSALACTEREEGEKAARAGSDRAVIEKEEAAKAARAGSELALLEKDEAAKQARLRTLRLPSSASLRALDDVQTMMFGSARVEARRTPRRPRRRV